MSTSNEFDFETWSRLASEDPERFDEMRRQAIESLIARAPPEKQRRLRGLQWRVDRVRERARTPVAACLRVSEMMWDSVAGKDGLLETLASLADSTGVARPAKKTLATVLELRPPDGRPKA